MKKKGFTLVELLAVIVILGIILLIAIPKISNVIDNSKEKAFQVSSFGIVKAANYYCETKRLTDLTYPGGTFTAANGKLVNGSEELPVSDIVLEGDSFVNIDENCNVQMSVTDGLYYATKEYDEVGVAVTLSEDAALTRDELTQRVITLEETIGTMVDTSNLNNLYLKTYPIGSIYSSVNSANPSTLFGGTWIAWGSGRVPVGVNTSDTSFDTVEEMGGEKNHTLIEGELPYLFGKWPARVPFGHSTFSSGIAYGEGTTFGTMSYGVGEGTITSESYGWNIHFGNNQPHNNLQPYITVYMWKRTA